MRWRRQEDGAYTTADYAEGSALANRVEVWFDGRTPADPQVHDLLAELGPCDWVLVEGFKRAALPKIEIWRASTGQPARYPDDRHIVAICTDSAGKARS